MEAKELRIGNWVNVIKSVPVQITAHHIVAISEGDGQYSPVPLTAEWLKKFGFENKGVFVNKQIIEGSPSGDMDGATEYRNDRYNAIFVKDGRFHYEISNCHDEYGQGIDALQIEYVHQLQNLFFALTGEELTISEKTANIESC